MGLYLTQAAILAALTDPAVTAEGVTFPDVVAVGNAVSAIMLSASDLECIDAEGVYQGIGLIAASFAFAVGAAGDVDSLTINADGTAEFAAGIILPTADPGIAGAWWDNAGTPAKSAGP